MAVHTDLSRFRFVGVDTVDSTNDYLRSLSTPPTDRITLLTAEYQTAGRGSGSNRWESERGRNLLLSLLLHPRELKAGRMFALSEVTSLALCEALAAEALASGHAEGGFSIKWPNDIYYGDKKMVGMLVENDLQGGLVTRSVIGVGINVNQLAFVGDAPNPISLAQVLGHEVERRSVLLSFAARFSRYHAMMEEGAFDELHELYARRLYRKGECHLYQDEGGQFRAVLIGVEPSGHLLLEREDGGMARYAFKEVKFII